VKPKPRGRPRNAGKAKKTTTGKSKKPASAAASALSAASLSTYEFDNVAAATLKKAELVASDSVNVAATAAATLEKVASAAIAAVNASSSAVEVQSRPPPENKEELIIMQYKWKIEDLKLEQRRMDMQEQAQSLKHSRDVELKKLDALHFLKVMEAGKTRPSIEAKEATRKPKSQLGVLQAFSTCRKLLSDAGCGDLTDLSKPADVVKFAIEFVGSPSLEAVVAGADETCDKLNFVIDTLLG